MTLSCIQTLQDFLCLFLNISSAWNSPSFLSSYEFLSFLSKNSGAAYKVCLAFFWSSFSHKNVFLLNFVLNLMKKFVSHFG